MTRRLIVNADDFGRAAGINAGVMKAFEDGIVTSATLMVRYPDARAAADYARTRDDLSLGLHIDLGEWEYVDDGWRLRYQVVDTDDAAAVDKEVARQLGLFEEIAGRRPSHLDSHQHVHRSEPVRSIVVAAAERLGVPVRDATPHIRYRGDFYGQDGRGYPVPEAITPVALVGVLDGLPDGITELGCHPGLGPVDDVYGSEREIETRTLCEPGIRAAIERLGIELCSFADV